MDHLESAYVGLVEESGSLFAMSPDRFPLVAFTGGRKRRENAMKLRSYGSGDDECLGRASSYTDRRCLVGMHPLEGGDGDSPENRLKRLVDGVPGVVRGDHR
jgi:serine/threonine-protein kinase/endoribonuclease IRE1